MRSSAKHAWLLLTMSSLTPVYVGACGPRAARAAPGSATVGAAVVQAPSDSTWFLRRLAAAADGIRGDDREVYLVASAAAWRANPNAMVRAFPTRAEAERGLVQLRAEGYAIHGPFRTAARLTHSETRVTRVTVHYDDGRTVERAVGGYDGIDAIFFSEAALDKFVYPYYVSILRPDQLRVLQDTLEQSHFWDHDVTTVMTRHR